RSGRLRAPCHLPPTPPTTPSLTAHHAPRSRGPRTQHSASSAAPTGDAPRHFISLDSTHHQPRPHERRPSPAPQSPPPRARETHPTAGRRPTARAANHAHDPHNPHSHTPPPPATRPATPAPAPPRRDSPHRMTPQHTPHPPRPHARRPSPAPPPPAACSRDGPHRRTPSHRELGEGRARPVQSPIAGTPPRIDSTAHPHASPTPQ